MTYESFVEEETLHLLEHQLDQFLEPHRFNPEAQTIILIPGGMGSRLRRARRPINPEHPVPPKSFSTIWAGCGLIFDKAAEKIRILPDGHDLDDRIIIADNVVKFFVHPYDRCIRFFRNEGWNVFVFGWDWRRKVTTSVDLLHHIMTEMSQKVLDQYGVDILPNTRVVGHSMGGMIAKIWMTDYPDMAAKTQGMISVGSPFYGYFGQMRRFYNGDYIFNDIYGAPTVAKVTSSMPGMYSLLPIDKATFDRDGAAIGLDTYPVMDPDGCTIADPYSEAVLPRYPSWVRTEQIPRGKDVRVLLSQPVREDLTDRVYHLRGAEPDSTETSAVWQTTLPPDYVPGTSPSPIQFGKTKGDGVIPLWSSRLASTPDANIFDFPFGGHALLMEKDAILVRLYEILTGRRATVESLHKELGPEPLVEDLEEALHFVRSSASGEVSRATPHRSAKGLSGIVHPSVVRRLMVESGW